MTHGYARNTLKYQVKPRYRMNRRRCEREKLARKGDGRGDNGRYRSRQ